MSAPDILFYSRGGIEPAPESRPKEVTPGAFEWKVWRPHSWHPAPAGTLNTSSRFAWWGLHHLRIFRNRDHAVVMVSQRGRCIHRTVFVPPFYRFPFMGRDDLQLGDIWTDPSARGQGVAEEAGRLGMRETNRVGRKYWYLTESENVASNRLAQKLGFELEGRGLRSKPFGFRAFGRFLMTSSASSVR